MRYHIRKRFDEDPELYERLSKRLDRILTEFKDRWDELAAALDELADEAQSGRQADETGLDPDIEAPFYGVLKQELGDGELPEQLMPAAADITRELVAVITAEIALADFWNKVQAQEALRHDIVQRLDAEDLLPFDRLPRVADRLVELAKVNHDKLVRR